MYKIKIINYKPYEYQILQEQLDQLGKEGYYTDDLAFLSFFKKKNHPVYYKIDFFRQTGKSKFEKDTLKDRFYDPYLDDKYVPIYNKNGMYVFVGEKPSKVQVNWSNQKKFINDKKRFQSLNHLIFSFLITLLLIIGSFFVIKFDTFSTYGMTFVYIGAILSCLTAIYRNFCNFYEYRQFHKTIQAGIPQLSQGKLKKLRLIYKIATILCLILIGGGLIEDCFNVKDISKNDSQLLIFEDLGLQDVSEFSSLSKSSFTIPHYYTALEVIDNDVLYTKQYQFNSEKKALNVIKTLIEKPSLCDCTSLQRKDTVTYGYYEDKLTTLIIQKENIVTIVNFSFAYTDTQIQTIIDYYSKKVT